MLFSSGILNIVLHSQLVARTFLLYLRINIEERVNALLQPRLNLFLAALQQMQRHVLFATVLQRDRTRSHALQLTFRKQSQPIHQR